MLMLVCLKVYKVVAVVIWEECDVCMYRCEVVVIVVWREEYIGIVDRKLKVLPVLTVEQ